MCHITTVAVVDMGGMALSTNRWKHDASDPAVVVPSDLKQETWLVGLIWSKLSEKKPETRDKT